MIKQKDLEKTRDGLMETMRNYPGKGFTPHEKELFLEGLEAALSSDREKALEVGSRIGTDGEVREGTRTFVYGAFHLCSAAMAMLGGNADQAERCLRMANSYATF